MKRFLGVAVVALALASLATAAPRNYSGAHATPRVPGAMEMSAAAGQSGSGVQTLLNWTASTSASSCLPTSTPACTLGYFVFRGTAAGGESSTPLNSTPITATTYTDSTVTVGSAPASFFYVAKAVETVAGVQGQLSAASNEASITFPGTPAAPTGLTAAP